MTPAGGIGRQGFLNSGNGRSACRREYQNSKWGRDSVIPSPPRACLSWTQGVAALRDVELPEDGDNVAKAKKCRVVGYWIETPR